MSLDDFDFFNAPSVSNTTSEDSEVFRAAVAKSIAGIKQTKSDEKKSKNYDTLLIAFLQRILKNPNDTDKQFVDAAVFFLSLGTSSSIIMLLVSLYEYQSFIDLWWVYELDKWNNGDFDEFMHVWIVMSFWQIKNFSDLQAKKFLLQKNINEYQNAFSNVFVYSLARYSLDDEKIRKYSIIIFEELSKRLEAICNQSFLLKNE